MTEIGYRREIIRRCKSVGTYRDEFKATIERLARLYVRAARLERQFEDTGAASVVMYTNKSGAENPVKNPLLVALDDCYDRILAHEREIGLTAASLKRINDKSLSKAAQSPLAAALQSIAARSKDE